jgi:hypothetical protein
MANRHANVELRNPGIEVADPRNIAWSQKGLIST